MAKAIATKATNPLLTSIPLDGIAALPAASIADVTVPTVFADGKPVKGFTGKQLIAAAAGDVSGRVMVEQADEKFAHQSGLTRGQSVSDAILLLCGAAYHGAEGDHIAKVQAVEAFRLGFIAAVKGEIRTKALRAALEQWETTGGGKTQSSKDAQASERRALNTIRVPFSRVMSAIGIPAAETYGITLPKPNGETPKFKLPGAPDKEAFPLARPTDFEKAKRQVQDYLAKPVAARAAATKPSPAGVSTDATTAASIMAAHVAKEGVEAATEGLADPKWEIKVSTTKLVSLVAELAALSSVGGKVQLNVEEAALAADANAKILAAVDAVFKVANRVKQRRADNAKAEKASSAKMAG